MKNKLLFLIIAVLSFACKRESPCGEPYESKSYNYYLADSNKANFPYTKIDTLVFVNQDWDTAILVNSEGVKLYTERNGINGDNNPACPKWDYFYYEKMYTKFTGKNKNFDRIDVLMEPTQYYGDHLYFAINRQFEYQHSAAYFFHPINYITPIQFKGKLHYAVVKTSTSHPLTKSQILFDKTEGLIAYKLNDSNIYIKQ